MSKKIRKEDKCKKGCITTFDVYDFGLAATLLTLAHELIFVHELEDRTGFVFHFIYTPKIQHDENAYWNGGLQVSPQSYYYELNQLEYRLEGVSRVKD